MQHSLPGWSQPITPDSVHSKAVDEATDADRRWFADPTAPRSFVRLARPHELCPPGGPCVDPVLLRVVELTPGVRMRLPA